MLDVVDNLIIGGGMAYTFVKNNGGTIGDSIFEKDKLSDCSEIISLAQEKGVAIFFPEDVVASNEFSNNGLKKILNINNIPKGWQGLDIGPTTTSKFEKIGGCLDLQTPRALVYTIHVSIGFKTIESILDETCEDYTEVVWYYGNVYDPEDGITPLEWWLDFDCQD